jgi:hypothetical protein
MLVHLSLLSYVQVVLSSSWSLHAACDNVPATLPPKRRAFVDPGAAEYDSIDAIALSEGVAAGA